MTRESLDLLLAKQALNREDGAKLSSIWLPACELLEETGTEKNEISTPDHRNGNGCQVLHTRRNLLLRIICHLITFNPFIATDIIVSLIIYL